MAPLGTYFWKKTIDCIRDVGMNSGFRFREQHHEC